MLAISRNDVVRKRSNDVLTFVRNDVVSAIEVLSKPA